jgi:hypothetical protein
MSATDGRPWAVEIRAYDYVPRLEQLTFLAAREALGIPAECEFKEYSRPTVTTPGHMIYSRHKAPDEPGVAMFVCHSDGERFNAPVAAPADVPQPVVDLHMGWNGWGDDGPIAMAELPEAAARVGTKLDALGVEWDYHVAIGDDEAELVATPKPVLERAAEATPGLHAAVDRPATAHPARPGQARARAAEARLRPPTLRLEKRKR